MKVASLDIGLKRIGMAVCLTSDIVTPLEAVLRTNRNQAARDVKRVLNEWEIDTLVVGLPLGGSSEEGMRRRIEHFTALLNFEGPIYLQDEYGTSIEASELTKGVMKHKRDGKLDSIAAKIILERWLQKQ